MTCGCPVARRLSLPGLTKALRWELSCPSAYIVSSEVTSSTPGSGRSANVLYQGGIQAQNLDDLRSPIRRADAISCAPHARYTRGRGPISSPHLKTFITRRGKRVRQPRHVKAGICRRLGLLPISGRFCKILRNCCLNPARILSNKSQRTGQVGDVYGGLLPGESGEKEGLT